MGAMISGWGGVEGVLLRKYMILQELAFSESLYQYEFEVLAGIYFEMK